MNTGPNLPHTANHGPDTESRLVLVVSTCLILMILSVYWQVTGHEFTTYDDDVYVTKHHTIKNGLTLPAIGWAFTGTHGGNWHPLTSLSHMLDCQLYGLNPGMHHLTNVFFHMANTLLLFFVFRKMTDAIWKSAFVAALFAVHPLHVESVAWVAERKDVLSTFFWMLTMGAYAWYVKRPGIQRYLWVLICFGLGLMAKPMLVTLPFVLLLLDYWPLRRFDPEQSTLKNRTEINKQEVSDQNKGKPDNTAAVEVEVIGEKSESYRCQWLLIRPLLWEKAPLFAMTVLLSVVTYMVQKAWGAMSSIEALPVTVRVANAFVAYFAYIGKMFWPVKLAVFYPHPGLRPTWQILGAVFLLITVTSIVLWRARKSPYLALGWLWYAGTLVPVIGIVQVGAQAMADRYTYVPLIGLFIMAAWGIPELVKRLHYRKEVLLALSVFSLSGLCVVTWIQVGYWQDSITLFDHTLKVTEHNSLAYVNRGVAYRESGNHARAIEDFNRAIEINPRSPEAFYNRGVSLNSLGKFTRAIQDFNRVIKVKPKISAAFSGRGVSYDKLGHFGRAIEDFDRALEIDPGNTDVYYNRGITYVRLGNYTQAIRDFSRVVEVNPKDAQAYTIRGIVYDRLGYSSQAIRDFDKAIEVNPAYERAYHSRQRVLKRYGESGRAE